MVMTRWAGVAFVLAIIFALSAAFLGLPSLLLASWLGVAAALCILSPTMSLTGSRRFGVDIAMVLAFAVLGLSGMADAIRLQLTATQEGIALISAAIILILVSFSLSSVEMHKHSIIAALRIHRGRPFWIFLMLLGISVVFTLLLLVLRSIPLLIICALLIIALAHKRFRAGAGGIARHLLQLFLNARTVLLGISGLLILSLLVHAGSPVIGLLPAALRQVIRGADALLIAGYLLSAAGAILLLLLPAYIWYKILKLRTTGSYEHLPDWRGWQVGLAAAAMAAHFLLPLFSIEPSSGTTAGLRAVPHAIASPGVALATAAAIFLCCAALGMHGYARKVIMLAPILASLVFFGACIYAYFISSFIHYLQLIILLADAGAYLALPVAVLLFLITAVFFITGFLSFLYEIWRD
jgi:hypothetical protein